MKVPGAKPQEQEDSPARANTLVGFVSRGGARDFTACQAGFAAQVMWGDLPMGLKVVRATMLQELSPQGPQGLHLLFYSPWKGFAAGRDKN